ncbi:MAG: hypothetical protein JWM68_318 [Verrucomicrobiales bacterium]|nr:hypothetical protein [Verrucomicrobiales bacterium]
MKVKTYSALCGLTLLAVLFVVINRRNATTAEAGSSLGKTSTATHPFKIANHGAVFPAHDAPIVSITAIERLQQLLSMEPTDEVLKQLTELIGAMKADDFPKHLEVFDQAPPGSVLSSALSLYLKKWSETDPKAVLDFTFKSETGPPSKLDAAAGAVAVFAAKDFAGASAYLQQVEDPERKSILLNQLAPALASADAARTIDWIKSLPGDEPKQRATFRALQQLTVINLDAAVDWVYSMRNEPFLRPVMVGVCLMIAESDPSRAVKFLPHIADGPGKDETIQSIFGGWQLVSPAEAAQYIVAMPPGREKEIAAKAAMAVEAGPTAGQ